MKVRGRKILLIWKCANLSVNLPSSALTREGVTGEEPPPTGTWRNRHGKPFTLELTGPAGGVYTEGSGGVELTCDAIEFCRTLAGRAPGSGLLAQQVPF